MMKVLLAFSIIAMAAPAAAQQPAPAAPPAATPAPIDPARLALAKTTIERIWPLGTYARMMDGTMDQMMDAMMASMMDSTIGDITATGGVPGAVPDEHAGMTMREAMAKYDPHFEERMRISNKVMMDSLSGVMTRMEPQVRDGLARAYARKFTAAQLTDLNTFFATPSGSAYAKESMMLFVDPEIMALMGTMAPELMKEMPAIAEKVKAATARLPPPRKPEEMVEEKDEETTS